MSALAGRCHCGVILAWAWGDEHLACRGESWCRTCGVVLPREAFPNHAGQWAPRGRCWPCYRAEDAAQSRERMADPVLHARHLEVKRASDRRSRRAGGARYVRDKERKRSRYQTDAAWRERKVAATRERRRLARERAA